jgi:hypothetical protein
MRQWIRLVRKINTLIHKSSNQSTTGGVYCAALLSDVKELAKTPYGGAWCFS